MQNKPLVLALSHCLLNQKVRAEGLTPHPEIKKKILALAKKYNAKIEQLPCPEFLLLGEREPKTYDEYMEIGSFKNLCEKLAGDVIDNLKKFRNHSIVVIGIARSPSCSVSHVYDRQNNLKKGNGAFIRILRKKSPATKSLLWRFTEIDYRDIDVSIEKIEKVLKTF